MKNTRQPVYQKGLQLQTHFASYEEPQPIHEADLPKHVFSSSFRRKMFINKLAQNAKRQSASTLSNNSSVTPSSQIYSSRDVTPSRFKPLHTERQKSFVSNALQEIAQEGRLKEERKTKTPQPKKKQYRVDPFDLYSYNIARLNEVVEDQNLGEYVGDIEQELNFEKNKKIQDRMNKYNLRQRQWSNSKDIKSQFPPLSSNTWSKRKQGRTMKDKSESQKSVSPIRSATARDPVFDVNNEINSPFFMDIVKDIDTTKDVDQRISKRLASRRSYVTASQDGLMSARGVDTNHTKYPSNFSVNDFAKSEGSFPPNYLQSLVEGRAREEEENFSYFTASLNEEVGRPYPLHFMSHREKQLAQDQRVTNSIHKNLYLEQVDEYNRDAAKYKSPFIYLEQILASAESKQGELKKPSSFITLIVTQIFDKFIEMMPKFNSLLRQMQKYLIEAIYVNPQSAFQEYPPYKLKTDHYDNGSQAIENYRFIVPKFQECLPYHEAYKALISEILTLKEQNHKYRQRYWNEYRYSKIIDKWVRRIVSQQDKLLKFRRKKSFLRTVFNEWVMVERGNADIWQTLMEAQAKAQKIPLRKAFNAIKNNLQNNKERRYKEELNDLRFRVKENDQRITFLTSKINKMEYDKENVGKLMKDREEEMVHLQNELRLRSVSINDPELIRISLVSYFDQLFNKNKGLRLIIENEAILSNHKHQRIHKLLPLEESKRVSFNRIIALWANYMLGLTRNQIITRTRCISNVDESTFKRQSSSKRKQRLKKLESDEEIDTSLDTPLRQESKQRLKNTPLKVGDVEQLYQPDYRALQNFLNLLPTKVTLKDTEQLTSPAVLISVMKSVFSDFSFVKLLRVWRKKPEDRHRKIMVLLQELLGLDVSTFLNPSDMNEGSVERSQEAFLKVYSLLFYKNAMLQKQGISSPKKQIFKENQQYLLSLKPFHYISEVYGPFLQNNAFQDILPILDRLELSKKMLSFKGIPKLLVRWVNLMIANFKKKQKREFFDTNFTTTSSQILQNSRGFSRSTKNILDLAAPMSSSSSSLPQSPEVLTPLSQSEKASTAGQVLYGMSHQGNRPRFNTTIISKFGVEANSSSEFRSTSPVGKKMRSGFHKTSTQVIDQERAERLTRQSSLVAQKRNSQHHSPSAASRLRKQVKNLMLMKQLSNKDKTTQKDPNQSLTIQGFPINDLNSLCNNQYLGLFILVIILEMPRSVHKRLNEEMLANIEVKNIWQEYKDILKVPICERYLIIVNGVYSIAHKKHLVNLDQLHNNAVSNIEEIVAEMFIRRCNLPVQQNTELAGHLQLVAEFYQVYKRALEESDLKNIVIDTTNKDLTTQEERELEKKHQKSLALDKVLKYAQEHHPQLDTALTTIHQHYQAYQQVMKGVTKWLGSQVLPKKVAQRIQIYNQPAIKEAINYQNLFPGRFVISQILHSYHRTYSPEMVDQIEDLFSEFEWPLKKMVHFFSSYDGGKMSYLDIWAFIKSFKLKTFEINPDDIEPNILREMKGADREVIFENDDDNQKSSTVEEEYYARSLSGITQNSQERRKEINANQPLVFYKLKIEPQIFFRVLIQTLIKNFSTKICDELYYIFVQKENCCKIGYVQSKIPNEPNYTANPKQISNIQKYKLKAGGVGGFELNILHSLENLHTETLVSSPPSSQSDQEQSTTQIYTQQRAKSGNLSPVRDQRTLNQWKDMGRVLKAFFKHCVLSRSQHFKKNIFRIEMRDPAFRKYLARIQTPLILIFQHYRCGTVVYSRRDSLFGSPLREGGHRNSSFSGLSRIEERVMPFDAKFSRLISQDDVIKLFIDISAFVGEGSLKSSQLKKIMEQVQNLDQLDRTVASLNARSDSSQSRFRRQGIGSGSASPMSSLLSVPQSPKPMQLLHSPVPGQRGLTFSDFVETLYLSAQYYYTDPYNEKLVKFGHFVENVLFKNLRQSIHFKKNFHSPYMQRLGKQIPSKRNCPKMEGSQLHADLFLSSKF